MPVVTKSLPSPRPQALVEELERLLPASAAVSIGLADLDLFGKFNEVHGAEAGDTLLGHVMGILDETVGDEGQLLRYGGDAFVAVLNGVEKEQAFLRMERARAAIGDADTLVVNGKDVAIDVSMSVGVAGSPDDATAAPLLVRKATDALYRAKGSGRNRVCLAREEKMVTKTTHYSQGQLEGLSRLSKRMGVSEAELLREALDDLFRKHNR